MTEVLVATADDLRAAIRNALNRCACTFPELKAMHDTGNYKTMRHRLAWIAIGDLYETDLW